MNGSKTQIYLIYEQDLNSDHLQYDDDDLLEVSNSFEYDWQLTGHRFIGAYSYINLKVMKINFINTPPYHPHKIQNLHKPIISINLQR